MSTTSRRTPARLSAVVAAGTACAFALLPLIAGRVGAVSPRAEQPHGAARVALSLAGTLEQGSSTWATVLMGKNSGTYNLFWQLFVRSGGGASFKLVTPPGVADNGGLVVAATGSGSSALVGFGASQDLLFSPLAYSSNDGRAWSQGGLDDALVKSPSALSASSKTAAVALVEDGAQAVLIEHGSLTAWEQLSTRAKLTNTIPGRRCRIKSLEGVALGASGSVLVGASCRATGTPGVLVSSDGTWHLAPIAVPGSLKGARFSVLRLSTSAALLEAVRGDQAALFSAWPRNDATSWEVAPVLRLGNNANVLATGVLGGREQFAVLEAGQKLTAELVQPNGSWRSIALPRGTATIATGPDNSLESLVVHHGTLKVLRQASHGSWSLIESVKVPIAYGSSS